MPRELSAAVTKIKNSQRFTYYDCAEIELPIGPGDAAPRVLKIATADITVQISFDFEAFIYAAFAGALARAPRAAEQMDWTTALETAFAAGPAALLAEAAVLISGLFTSSEYTDRMRTDDQFVEDLYRAFMGRTADSGGKAFWLALVATDGRDAVRDPGFTGSAEFAARVALLNAPVLDYNDARDWGDLSIAEGAAQDGVEFSLTNAENTYSDLIGQSGRRVYPAKAVVSRAFKLPDGSYELVRMLSGFAKFGALDGDNAKVAILTDLTPDGTDIVEEITQHCINIYRGDGCDSPDASPTCSHLITDTVNGCPAKAPALVIIDSAPPDNRPRFKGIPQLAPQPITPPPGGGGGGGGWGGGDYDPWDRLPCFVDGTLVKTPHGWRPIQEFEIGDEILVSDLARRRLVVSEVEFVSYSEAEETIGLEFEEGWVRCSLLQRFLKWSGDWPEARDLCSGVNLLFPFSATEPTLTLISAGEIEVLPVRHLHVKHPDHNFVVWPGIVGHNIKLGRGGNEGFLAY